MTILEFHVTALALITAMGLHTWINWKWKKHLQESIDHKLEEWEKCFTHRMDSHGNIVKRFTEERLHEFKEELKSTSRQRKASQTRKAVSLLKTKKIR